SYRILAHKETSFIVIALGLTLQQAPVEGKAQKKTQTICREISLSRPIGQKSAAGERGDHRKNARPTEFFLVDADPEDQKCHIAHNDANQEKRCHDEAQLHALHNRLTKKSAVYRFSVTPF